MIKRIALKCSEFTASLSTDRADDAGVAGDDNADDERRGCLQRGQPKAETAPDQLRHTTSRKRGAELRAAMSVVIQGLCQLLC